MKKQELPGCWDMTEQGELSGQEAKAKLCLQADGDGKPDRPWECKCLVEYL